MKIWLGLLTLTSLSFMYCVVLSHNQMLEVAAKAAKYFDHFEESNVTLQACLSIPIVVTTSIVGRASSLLH